MKRIVRDRLLSAEEAVKYDAIRHSVEEEMPDLLERHFDRRETNRQVRDLVLSLKSARQAMGLSVDALVARTGLDAATLERLESGHPDLPSIEFLARYSEAVGKRLTLALADPDVT